jgi:glycosyltransferase involved in cell wall biosynthesis
VAMLAHTYYLRDPRVRRQAEALAEAGVEIHVVSLSERNASGGYEPRHAVVNGVQVHRLPVIRKRGHLWRYALEYLATGVLGGLKLIQLQLRGRLDVVHVHNMPDLLVFAAFLPWLCGSTVVLDVHDPMPELFKSWDQGASNRLLVALLRVQEKVSCAFADRVISVNETMRENLRLKGVADEKIFIVNNFPDQKLFPICDPLTTWPRSKDGLVLLYCGTVTEHYDLALAVRAMARVAGEVPVRLRIVGEGNRLAEVLQLASALGVRDSIEHVGLVPIDKVRAEMKNADVGISCHRAGVFGDLYFSTKIVEYLTQGLPVLSPRTRTICRYLPDDCMFYFEPGNEAALADCLRFVWHNPAEVSRRVTNAREVLPRLSWQAEKGKFVAFYTNLVTSDRDHRERASARTR